jgi:hypothetical protein
MHHSAEDYGVAAANAAEWARKKMEKIISKGQDSAVQTIKSVRDNVPKDRLVGHAALDFGTDGNRLNVKLGGSTPLPFHKHAMIQVADRAGMPNPKRTVEWLSDPEILTDFASIMNKKYSQQAGKKYFTREVNGELRGFLSNRFKPMDSGPIIESFIGKCNEYGAVPIRGRALDTKFYLKFMLPFVMEPIPGEVMLFGAQLKNSDFGDGKLDISGFIHRLFCTNLMMTDDGFSRVHLGRRLTDEVEFSHETYAHDTATIASAVGDVVKAVFAPENVKTKMTRIKAINEEKVDADAVIEGLRKGKITKAEAEEVKDIFKSADVELLPPGNSAWRLSNAISLLAQKSEPERELELEAVAGDVIGFQKAA